jgi:hypothetical protein
LPLNVEWLDDQTVIRERSISMKHDPFGNLTDWGTVLDTLEELADTNKLFECQPGLIRILRFKGNWRLREEVLKRIGNIQTPSEDLFYQVLSILGDDNVYYDARVIAGEALSSMLKNVHASSYGEMAVAVEKVIEKIRRTPQPPFFEEALDNTFSEIAAPSMLVN